MPALISEYEVKKMAINQFNEVMKMHEYMDKLFWKTLNLPRDIQGNELAPFG